MDAALQEAAASMNRTGPCADWEAVGVRVELKLGDGDLLLGPGETKNVKLSAIFNEPTVGSVMDGFEPKTFGFRISAMSGNETGYAQVQVTPFPQSRQACVHSLVSFCGPFLTIPTSLLSSIGTHSTTLRSMRWTPSLMSFPTFSVPSPRTSACASDWQPPISLNVSCIAGALHPRACPLHSSPAVTADVLLDFSGCRSS